MKHGRIGRTDRRARTLIIISLGGSVIVREHEVDIPFIRAFKKIIFAQTRHGRDFYIVTGGGAWCRAYQTAARAMGVSDEGLDWIGIRMTAVNREFMQRVCAGTTHVNFCGGTKPGRSSDASAVALAVHAHAALVINISNVGGVYDSDPSQHARARCFDRLTWDAYMKLIPKKWSPGMHTPFDPVAARAARRHNISVACIDGAHLSELGRVIAGKKFTGTMIAS